jgi:glycosyltransferase involved in cell wall biosynthesis
MAAGTALTSAAIIASYNGRAFIEDAVLSVADQVDEVVVVDDCSTDDSYALLSQLSHPRIRVLRNETNQGVSRTLNRAVDQTSADILIIQGGDDRSLPGRVEQQVAVLEDESVSLVYSRPRVINSQGNVLPDSAAFDFFPEASEREHVARLLYENNYICGPAVAVRRKDYLAVGGSHPSLDLLQDYDMWLKLTEFGRIVELPSRVVEYRKHATNLSRDYVGIDGPRHRRLRVEQDFVRNSFIEHASTATLDVIARSLGLDVAAFAQLDDFAKVAVLQLAHPDTTVRRHGVFRLVDIAARPVVTDAMSAFGLDRAGLPAAMFAADIDNMAEVARGLEAGAPVPVPRAEPPQASGLRRRLRSVASRSPRQLLAAVARRIRR